MNRRLSDYQTEEKGKKGGDTHELSFRRPS
jgi:hypothetical protein